MMKNPYRMVGSLAVSLVLTAGSWAQKSLSSPTDIAKEWTAAEPLYISGQVGMRSEDLTSLSSWLKDNAPHWSVVIVEHARGLSYSTGADRYQNLDALEYAVGHGVMGRVDFAGLVDQAGDRDGVLFVVALAERQFIYFGESAYDKRGLGEANWQGNLDRWAIAAMRSGGNVVRAVQDTATNVIDSLAKKRQAEVAAVERNKETQRQQVLAQTKELEQLVGRVEKMQNEVGFVSLPQGALDEHRTLATTVLQAPDSSRIQEIQRALIVEKQALVAVSRFAGAVGQLAAAKAEDRDPPAVKTGVFVTSDLESEWTVRLQGARRTLQTSIAQAESSFESKAVSFVKEAELADGAAKAYVAQIRQRETAFAMAGFTGWGGVLIVLAGFGTFLVVAASRSLTSSRQFKRELAKVDGDLASKSSRLVDMLNALERIPGLTKAGCYEGETKRRAEEVTRLAGELFLVIAGARQLVDAARSKTQVRLAVLRWKPFDDALKGLENDASEVKPDSNLEMVLGGRRTKFLSLAEDPSSYAPVRMNLREVLGVFANRARDFDASFKSIQVAWDRVFPWLDEAERRMKATSSRPLEHIREPADFQPMLAHSLNGFASIRKASTADFVGAWARIESEGSDLERGALWSEELGQLDATVGGLRATYGDKPWIRSAAAAAVDAMDAPGKIYQGQKVLEAAQKTWEIQVRTVRSVVSGLEDLGKRAREIEERVRIGSEEGTPVELFDAVAETAGSFEEHTNAGRPLVMADLTELEEQLESCRRACSFYETAEQTVGKAIVSMEQDAKQDEERAKRVRIMLDEMLVRYSASAFDLEKAGFAAEGGDATAANNANEVHEELLRAGGWIKLAKERFGVRAFRQASESVENAGRHSVRARDRMQEVERIKELLDRSEADAGAAIQMAEQALAGIDTIDLKPQSIRSGADDLRLAVQRARTAAQARPLDMEGMTRLAEKARERATRLQAELEAQQRARSSMIDLAQTFETEARAYADLLDKTSRDDLPDGQALARAPRPDEFRSAMQALAAKTAEPAEWTAVLDQMGDVRNSMIGAIAALRAEAQDAQRALDALRECRRAVSGLNAWSSGYGHRPDMGALGILTQAQNAYDGVRFSDAFALANSAAAHAERALAAVRSQEDASRRAAEARARAAAEAARRAAEARRRESSSSSSSSWGSGGSRSSFGSSSGGSRSSFSSRSGGARSGW